VTRRRSRPADPVASGFGRRWWSQRWIAALESFGWASRLARGRRYARASRVVALKIQSGRVDAEVQGSRYEPYRVRIGVKTLTSREWAKVVSAMASQAWFAAKLLSGEMPANIEDAFKDVKLTLLPRSREDLTTACSCPDVANPCKHTAAVNYVLAQKFDEDPFLIFKLRGRERNEILEALRAERSRGASAPEKASARKPASKKDTPLSAEIHRFWQAGPGLDQIRVSVSPPSVWGALLKRLGLPPFWKDAPEIRLALDRLYAKVTERAMALAYGGRGMKHSKGEK